MSKSLYSTLEIGENASADEIKKAYRRLARKYHPDINKEAGAEEKFKEITAAYEILSDPQKKAQYDQFGDGMFGGQNFSDFARGSGGVNLDDILSQIFGNGGGFSSRSTGGGFNFGDGMFGGNSFGGFGGGFGSMNLDLKDSITIPFFTAILGGKYHYEQNGGFDIKIPAGIQDGETIRLKGKGRSQGGRSGDLLLKIQVAPSDEYTRDGNDLIKMLDIPLKTALFGGSIQVQTPHKEVTLKIPKGVKNNQKFRLKELGGINRKNGIKGDLYLKANITLPAIDSLSEELQTQLQKEL